MSSPSFEETINASFIWCEAWESGELSDEVLADRVGDLLKSETGLRGFFAFCLASDCPLLDRLPDTMIFLFREVGESLVDITVKNLAMSTAMKVHHQRNSDENQRIGAERVVLRCIDLLRLLDATLVKKRLELLLKGIKGQDSDVQFLDKWNYDDEQKNEIAQSIYLIPEH